MREQIITSLDFYYHSLAREYYQKYCIANDEYNKISDNNKPFDILSHSEDENNMYFMSWRQKQKNAIIAIVFEAMAVESFINYYIVKTYNNDVFIKEYKEKSIWVKYKIIVNKITGKKFEDYKEEYELFSTLISIRNNMIHSKSQIVDLFNEDSQKFIDNMSEMFGGIEVNIFNSIDKVINTYDVLNKLLK